MPKFLVTILVISIFCSAAVAADKSTHFPQKPLSGQKREVPAPFPPLVPIEQKDYEKTLPVDEQDWIHQACRHIESNLKDEKGYFTDLSSCCLTVNQHGNILEPILFSTKVSETQENAMKRLIIGLSPLPALSSAQPEQRILIVRFDKSGGISIRFRN